MATSIKRQSCLMVIILAAILLALAAGPGAVLAAEIDQARAAAQKGLKYWLGVIPEEDLIHYGFDSQAQLQRATLGEPFQLHTIPPDKILAYSGEDLSQIVFPLHTWLFPIEADGQTRALLTVDKVDGGFKAVAIGAAGLSRQLQAVRSQWAGALASGQELKLVRVYQATSDFVALSGAGPTRLVPLESAALALGLELPQAAQGTGPVVFGAFDPDRLMPRLQQVVRQNLAR